MSNPQSDFLFQLIKSLSKAEKRNFKLYAKRNSSKDELKFIQLFDFLDHQSSMDEQLILKKVPSIKKAQLSNLKAHLYKQLLTSLRLNHVQHNIDMEIRENIDHARVLYNKGLYRQSLKILDKMKGIAESANPILYLEILQFEKYIEFHHITRSINSKAEELTKEADKVMKHVSQQILFSNLSLRLYGLYLKVGYIRNEKDHFIIKEFFESNLPTYEIQELSFFEKVYMYQCQVWYHYITHDFINCYKYASKWVDLFCTDYLKELHSELYIKSLHNLLAALFNVRHYSKFVITLEKLQSFGNEKKSKFNENEAIALFLYEYTNRINKHFLNGTFDEGLNLVPLIESQLVEFEPKLDYHRVLVLYYKIACLYFGSGDNKNAIKYLNRIISFKVDNIREDIHCFARILNLIAHFELENDDLIEYQIKSVYRFLHKIDDLHLVQKEILLFLRKLGKIRKMDLKIEFIKLKSRLNKLHNDPYEQRAFLYLDITSWLEAKINDVSIQEVIQQNFKEHQANFNR